MEVLKSLPPREAKIVLDLIDALKVRAESKINPGSNICTERFSQDFIARLKIYHALNDDVLKKKTFEYAFASSMRFDGRSAVVSENSVISGADVVVDNTRFSLKTEASKSMSLGKITISKLMEARWIRNCTDADSILTFVKSHVVGHLGRYERILVLRAFKRSASYRYRLVEIPLDLLMKMNFLISGDFSPRTKNGSSRAAVRIDGVSAFSVSLDGSVEKITISGLLESLCIVHGEWEIPVAGLLETVD